MSAASNQRSESFLKISGQFKLGALLTESSHPVTASLSDAARRDIVLALDLLFQVDSDVVAKYRDFAESGRAGRIKQTVLRTLQSGGKLFFTGCGSTGRLSIQIVSIWREFWQRMRAQGGISPSAAAEPTRPVYATNGAALVADSTRSGANQPPAWNTADLEDRAVSVVAGGDFALIKSVEGFEDFAAFGKKQLGDLGVSDKDVVFAITEAGETPFVIGTVWKAVESGAKVYFVYNNPDDVLCAHLRRSREVLADPRIEKINLTTGPMAITGSTRMQATSIQLCVLLTVMEMVARDLTPKNSLDSTGVPAEFLRRLEEMHATLRSREVLSQLARLVVLEESVYRSGHKNNYYADRFAIDVLTDTTERSPTYCTPPFRKFDDPAASESWSFLFLPEAETSRAWHRILKREPNCLEWTEDEVRDLVGEDQAQRTYEIVREIGCAELMRFKISLDGIEYRRLREGDSAIAILSQPEKDSLVPPNGFYRAQLEAARRAGASSGLISFGGDDVASEFLTRYPDVAAAVLVRIPKTDFLLDGVTRVGVKMLLNALSTCTMVRLGRVIGNTMTYVVPSNLKLIDRATRYVQQLAGLSYEAANRLLFEVIEYVEPRMKADKAYPPVVELAVTRARHGLTNESAEKRLLAQPAP